MPAKDLILFPRDGFFCKDGRGWKSSESGRSRSLDWPYPSTMLGALCTSWGLRLESQDERLLNKNEWLALKDKLSVDILMPVQKSPFEASENARLMWPTPADSLYLENVSEIFPLTPTSFP